MSGLIVALVVTAFAAVLLFFAIRRRRWALARAGYIDELKRVAQGRDEDFSLITRVSAGLADVRELDELKRWLAAELPKLMDTEHCWVIGRLNGWVLLAGEPAEAESVMPGDLTTKQDAWECFPLIAGDKAVGLMGASRPPGGLTDEKRRVLGVLSTHVALAIRNIQQFNQARDLSMVDPLTRCLTRQFGIDALSREMRRMRRGQTALCVAILDLDRFKTLNDTHGHPAGDRALTMVGRVLKEGLRASDVACRYGGDEFLIVLPDTSLAGALRAVENIRRRIGSTMIDTDVEPIAMSASVGVTVVEPGEEDPAAPITRADTGMYEAKRLGRNGVHVRTPSEAGPLAPLPFPSDSGWAAR